MDSPKGTFIKHLLEGPGFTSPERVFSGLTLEQATAKPNNSHHCIADILAHLNFWQNWAFAAIDGKHQPMPPQAAVGWSGLNGSWDDLIKEFLAGLEKAKTLTENEPLLEQPFDPESRIGWGFEKHSIGEVIVDVIAVHNAYHLGQIILLRRMPEAWPPEGGGMTW